MTGFHPERIPLARDGVLLALPDPELPMVTLRGSVDAGARHHLSQPDGLAALAARLLRRGTSARSRSEIALLLDDRGAGLTFWAGHDETGFGLQCRSVDLDALLVLLGELLSEPSFPEDELELARGELLAQARERDDSPRARADHRALALLIGTEHPYAARVGGTVDSLPRLDRKAVSAFHAARFGPRGMLVAAAGDFDPRRLASALEEWFPGKEGPEPHPLPQVEFHPSAREVIPMAAKSQTAVSVMAPGVPVTHPDHPALALASLILGGFGLMGRLGQLLRDDRGLAYHVSCRSHFHRNYGIWRAQAGVEPGRVEPLLAGLRAEVERFREDGPTDEEVRDAASHLVGALPLRLESQEGRAGLAHYLEEYNLGMDYLDRYPERILAEGPRSIREAARAHLDPGGWVTVTAGPVASQ